MAEAGLMVLLWVVLGIPSLVAVVFFLLTQQHALAACSPTVRKMEPGMVWLQFVPIFNLVWQFLVVLAISESLQQEFQRRNLPVEPNPSRGIGLAVCILNCVSLVPIVNWVTLLPALVCWIVYWVKIAGLNSRLVAPV